MSSYHLLTKLAAPNIEFSRRMYPSSLERSAMQPSGVPAFVVGGAGLGGIGGAAVGGFGGLAGAMFDDEDDGIGSTIRKLLRGAAVGGLTGGLAGGLGMGAVGYGKRESGRRKLEAMEDWRRILREHQLSTAGELTRMSDAP